MPRKSQSYEDMMTKLEDIVNEMDVNNMSLEDSMKKYEDGIKLCNKMHKVLKEAEGKISILTEQGEKNFEEN